MNHDRKKILAVDDEEDILEILQFNLNAEGFDVDTALSAEDALSRDLGSYDIFILDVMMGRMSGFHLAEKMKNELRITRPVIFLTAKGTENDKITGFNLGADDYLSKPFSIKELTARVRAVLRRTSAVSPDITEAPGGFTINSVKKRIENDGIPVELTKKEFEILSLLISNPGKIYPRQELLDMIWGNDVIVTERTVDVTVARIRKKLGEKAEYLKNKSGYGYYFEE